MATSAYINNRKKYTRPQAIIWCDSYSFSGSTYVPSGNELEDFLILSDHNRKDIKVEQERIENRKRMINGTMRSYHVADKTKYSWSWDMLPSRGYTQEPSFTSLGGLERTQNPDPVLGIQTLPLLYTADGGAGGSDLLKWYEDHRGPFFMLMAYDKSQYSNLNSYTEVFEVYFSSFNYEVVKRGLTSHDFWNISVNLEEV
jgi:hypothetical protein